MAFAIEWTNPIFYLNMGGLACSVYLWIWSRGRDFDLPMKAFFAILAIGTGLHFVGDLFGLDENLDHIFIHGVLLVSLLLLVVAAARSARAA